MSLARSAPLASSSSPAAPLAPAYILRAHAAPVSCLTFSQCGRFLYSGDTDGYVAVWHLRSFRPRYMWKAHEGGVLGLAELEGGLLSQGRDNLIHLYRFPSSEHATTTAAVPAAATSVPSPSRPSPEFENGPAWSLDTNAMNFCRMSVLPLLKREQQEGKGKGRADPNEEEEDLPEQGGALIAVPSLTKDEFVDIFHYPTRARLHRSIGKDAFIGHKTGSVMAVQLWHLPSSEPASSRSDLTSAPTTTLHDDNPLASSSLEAEAKARADLHLLIGYESGHLALFRFVPTSSSSFEVVRESGAAMYYRPREGKMVEENEGWELVWVEKGHRDAVMSLAVDAKSRFAYTVAADHFLCKYRISDLSAEEALLPRMHMEATPSPGKSGVAIREDGKLLATAGWDGELRLYSAKTLAPLAVLSLHRLSLQAIAFAPTTLTSSYALGGTLYDSSEEEEDSDKEAGNTAADSRKGGRLRMWLATGGQESKISLWEPYPARK
ncbi:hypothetical protein JCM10908_002524 [Rhodotorula pacifica]|uniref:WD40 repeat domain-containing protein n=1 Tax=Rhodotorula pacifica TaxID=1495444 RepID=UPI0031729D36